MTSTLTLSTLKENLTALKTFLDDGETLGFTAPSYLRHKLSTLLDRIDGKGEDGRVKVALVGGFSTGKTSIVASWLSKTKDDMKIGVGESSNEVTVYNPDDTYQIIDTPGLYGHKRDTVGDKEAYKNKTRRYVSEAHVLLYVLDPVNPIKDSHKDELNWLFRQLNMLPRTIFVLSRFDKECDVGDEEEYQERFRTKKDNILERLTQLIGLTAEEAASLPIVAVSAAPDDKPINDWLNGDQAEYEALSHMASLRNAIHAIVENQGGYDILRLKATTSTIRDILFQPLDFAKTRGQKLQEDYAQTEKNVSLEKALLGEVPDNVKIASERTLKEIELLFNHLIDDISSSTPKTLQETLTRRLGETGEKLNEEITNIYKTEVLPLRQDAKQKIKEISFQDIQDLYHKYSMDKNIDIGVEGTFAISRSLGNDAWDNTLDSLIGFMKNDHILSTLEQFLGLGKGTAAGGAAGGIGSAAARTVKETAEAAAKEAAKEASKRGTKKAAKEAAKKAAETALKQAKWAGHVATFMPLVGLVAGAGMDIYKDHHASKQAEEFQSWKQDVTSCLRDGYRTVRHQMQMDPFLKNNFPYWEEFVALAATHQKELDEKKNEITRCADWLAHGEALEKDFTAS
ncbi:labile enterotoxin output A [Saccharibacter floricola DSM 15669]|uniref:Labile enterotoxin output A n=2 Tax=Saccharibacter TaxID=231052 RepID=A0ABQ0NYZ4_9PROT|nr:LeoA/HP0731 family dynamin-like GTPase [Saccharibacter floricola]GBQ06952.1 labile enterotoxin output A [Saccharibacter floricola DSM 15669]